jgi:hypothetical protein
MTNPVAVSTAILSIPILTFRICITRGREMLR